MIRILTVFLFSCILVSCNSESKKEYVADHKYPETTIKKDQRNSSKIKNKAEEALHFCRVNKFNTDFCILIDMSIHSGRKRFFVWNFKSGKISKQYLVGHGCGSNPWSKDESKDHPEFSNEDGSHLSSLGKYRLGNRGYSNWGIHINYILHGLEETNSNALKRFIIFHSWELMSDEEVFPGGSPEGWGCPTISNNAMKEIDPMVQNSEKPVLLWIYN